QALDLDDEVHAFRYLAADRFLRDLDVAHQDHVFHTAEAFARAVGVKRTHRAVVTGVHRREQVEALGAANFAQDDPVWTHTQRVLDQIADGDGALAFEVRRTGFEREPMRLLQAKLGRVLDRQHALARINHLRQGVEHRGLTRAGTARDDDVHPARAGDLQRGRHLVAHRAEVAKHVDGDRLLGELADRDRGAAQAERRNDDVDAAAILETRVGERRGLVDAAADLVDDTLRDLEQVLLVPELDRRELQLALLLDISLVGAIDHNIGDVGVVEQLFEGTEAEQLVDQHLLERKLLAAVEGDLELGQHLHDDRPKFFAE